MHIGNMKCDILVPWFLFAFFVAPALAVPQQPSVTAVLKQDLLLRAAQKAASPSPSPNASPSPKKDSKKPASDQCGTPYEGLPPLCTGDIALPPYTPRTVSKIISPTNSLTRTPTHSPTPTFVPICENEADPDNAGPDKCVCSQGTVYTTVAPASGPNPCPWTTLPITDAGPAPTFTAPPQTGHDLFLTTSGYQVFGCQSSLVSMEDNVAVTSCVGTSHPVSYLPHATVQVGSSTQNVGTLSSMAVFTAISSALASVCPDPPSGGSTACSNAVTLTGVAYPFNTTIEEMKRGVRMPATYTGEPLPSKTNVVDLARGLPDGKQYVTLNKRLGGGSGIAEKITEIVHDGELIISVLASNYTSTGIRDSMILMVATTFAGSASGNSCASLANWQGDGPARRDTTTGNSTLCSSTQFAAVEYMNYQLYPDNPAANLQVELQFQQNMMEIEEEIFDCEAEVGGILDFLVDLIPELEPLALEAKEFIDIGCEIADLIAN